MRKGLTKALIAGACAALCMGTASVSGQQVQVLGLPVTFAVTEDGVPKDVEVAKFTLIGLTDGGHVSILNNGIVYEMTTEEFSGKLPSINLNSLPIGTSLSGLGNGTYGAAVTELENMLVRQGYLEGAADESFDGNTANAVMAFQQATGLPVTGYAGVNTQLLLTQGEIGTIDQIIEVNYPDDGSGVNVVGGGSKEAESAKKVTVEDKFREIYQEVREDLTPFLGNEWSYTYDVYEGEGILSSGVSAGNVDVEEPPIDQISIQTSFEVVLQKNLMADGKIGLLPVFAIRSTGAYRPYVQSVDFVDGTASFSLVGAISTGNIEGITLKETDYLSLTQEAMRFLSQHDSVAVRINGKNNHFDYRLNVNQDKLGNFFNTVAAYVQG